MKSRKIESLQKLVAALGAVAAWGLWYYGGRHSYEATLGASGAATGCGVIAAACIVSYVWIELKTTTNQEKL